MRTYEKLTKLEREKLAAYQRYIAHYNIVFIILSVMSIITMVIGWSLIIVFENWSLICLGAYFLTIGFFTLLIALLFIMKRRKELFLIFDYKDSISGVFEITNADVKKVKIERKEIWRRE